MDSISFTQEALAAWGHQAETLEEASDIRSSSLRMIEGRREVYRHWLSLLKSECSPADRAVLLHRLSGIRQVIGVRKAVANLTDEQLLRPNGLPY